MESRLTSANSATTAQTTYTGFRRPLKLLQNIQVCIHSTMSSKVSVPTSKVSVIRSKREQKDSQNKNKTPSSYQTVSSKNALNVRQSTRSPSNFSKKLGTTSDSKGKTAESSEKKTAVGSLTSSPKWSHIKNKFENGVTEQDKVAKSANSGDSKRSLALNKSSKTVTSTKVENTPLIHRNKYLSARRDVSKRTSTGASVNQSVQSNSVINPSKYTDKSKTALSSRSENQKENINSTLPSPKNSLMNIPINSSSVHCKKSLDVSSDKSSETNSVTSVISSDNLHSLKSSISRSSVRLSASSSINSSSILSSSDKTAQQYLTSSFTKRNTINNKMSSLRSKQKIEDKPIVTFNQIIGKDSQSEHIVQNSKSFRNLSDSDANKSASNHANNRVSTNKPSAMSSNDLNKPLSSEIEKNENLVRNTQSSTKTVWVKDSTGNWVKKMNNDTKSTASYSKVASLRSKFLEPSNGGSTTLTKSSTTSNVPSKVALKTSRPLAKSSTTSSICHKTLIEDLSKKVAMKDSVQSDSSKLSKNSSTDEKESQEGKEDESTNLNIVQRAVLSFEGNLALLSPESQKRLKLVSEKVRAQTDDGKIARTKTSALGSYKSIDKPLSSAAVVTKKSDVQSSLGEPLLPVRSYLNRYHQMSKSLSAKEKSAKENESEKSITSTKQASARSSFFSSVHEKSSKTDKAASSAKNTVLPKADHCENEKSKTKLTMNLNLPCEQIDLKSNSEAKECALQPNSSFLWRKNGSANSGELSKSSTTSSVSLTSSDYRNYYDIENYYSSLEVEIEKGSEHSEEHIYIDSQESNSSENYASSCASSNYQNISRGSFLRSSQDEWADISEDEHRKSSVSSNSSSTLKRRRFKRYNNKDNVQCNSKSSNLSESQRQNTVFTDSSDTLYEGGNDCTFDTSDPDHFYEPVYECLGKYHASENDENCSLSLSPDEPGNIDSLHSSHTSLESAESMNHEKDFSKSCEANDEKDLQNKKSGNKISQLKRHLSWTKNDIRLELSSKFNKIKIKKNGRNSTEIGLKMQENDNPNTSPKKKTFIKCILRQKSAGSIPIKRSPSPKKESALFYVHLTMGREKQRPFSDSVISNEVVNNPADNFKNSKQPSDSDMSSVEAKTNQGRPRVRKFASGPVIQRPKTPPPLPPVQLNTKTLKEDNGAKVQCQKGKDSNSNSDIGESQFYAVLDPEYASSGNQLKNTLYENEVLKSIHGDCKTRTSYSSSIEDSNVGSAACLNSSLPSSRKVSGELNLDLLANFQSELLKSPFEEEPMYQFYQKDVQQRATLWYSVDGSESEFEDDASSKLSDPSDYQSPKRPVLQSQLSAMDLIHGEGGRRSLWCEVPEVIESGILKTISSNERRIQEAMFEVITSEASYLKSLNFLIEHFVQCPELNGDYAEKHIIDKREKHILFSDIKPVRDVSASLLASLEKRWLENIVIHNICDIIYEHASTSFSVYIKYCKNQLYQERTLRELKEKKPEFVTVLKKLESNPVCQSLDMHSFLMLPMQRITRMPLLIDAIFHRLSVDSPIYNSCKSALATVNKMVAECNEAARKMQRMEEMLVISQQIDFKECKGLALLSASRYLVKKGELVQLLMENSNRRTFSRNSRWCKIQLYLFLFSDLLVVTRKKSDDSYAVVDYCPRNMLQVMLVDENTPPLPVRLPSSYRNLFQLILLNNREGKTTEMLLSCLLESDRTRWINAVRPVKSDNPDEKIYEEWDCPQVQCTHAYIAQQPDELSLEEADVVNVFKKMSDGWFEGERIRDGIRGWFPSSHTVEIINSHVRARNLHQRYRLLMLSQSYLEEQYKAQATQTKK